ncbi:MAG: MFS transporter [Vicinamibacteria bacterium]
MTSEAPAPAAPTRRLLGLLEWPRHVSEAERRSLVAGGLGWMLDAMDVMLYSMVLAHLMLDLGMDKPTAGLLNSLTLLASAIGGLLFGFLADRVGRTRALMLSILVYSLASGACGLSTTIAQLALFRFLLGLGMGGEWTTGAALIAETWAPEHRGKALGLMQSTWAIGEMLAAGIVALVLPVYGWRAVFFVGVLPALVVFWIRRDVPESELWLKHQASGERGSLRVLWRKDIRWHGILATAMNAFGMFGYWGLFTWIPAYLALPVALGGRGLDLMQTTTWLVIMGVGKWFGYALFGFFADSAGRRRAYVTYLLVAAALVPLYGMAESPLWLLLLGPFVAFFGTGFFSGFSAVASELFPTEIRATAMGLSYNIGRGLSAAAPAIVGLLAARFGLGSAFFLQAAAFFVAALLALALPETKGRKLE